MPENRKEEFLFLGLWGKDKSKVFSLGKAGHRRHDLALTEREEEILCGKTPLPKPTGCRVQSLCECFPSVPNLTFQALGQLCPVEAVPAWPKALLRLRIHPSKPDPKHRMSSCCPHHHH